MHNKKDLTFTCLCLIDSTNLIVSFLLQSNKKEKEKEKKVPPTEPRNDSEQEIKPLGAVSSENLKGTSAQPQHQPHPPSSPPNSELRRTSKAERGIKRCLKNKAVRDKVTADSVDVIGAAGDPGSVTKPAFISRSQQQPQEVGAEHTVIHLPKATRETSEEKDTHCVKANVKSPGAQLLTAQAPQTQQEDDNREERTSSGQEQRDEGSVFSNTNKSQVSTAPALDKNNQLHPQTALVFRVVDPAAFFFSILHIIAHNLDAVYIFS